MNPKKNIVYVIVTSIMFGLGVIFFSLAITQYQVLTNSKASTVLPQCNRGNASATPSNIPCGSCSIPRDTIAISSSGAGTVPFSCEVLCNTSGDPGNLSGCPTGALPATFSDGSWFWCRNAGGAACTESSSDLITKGSMSGMWALSTQGTTNLTATFSVSNYTQCGRVQVDVNFTQIAGAVQDFGTSCEAPTQPPQETQPPQDTQPPQETQSPQDTPTTQPTQPQDTPTVQPTNSPTASPTKTSTPTATHTPIPTATNTPSPTATKTPTPTSTLTPKPTNSPTPVPTNTPVPPPTLTPTPSQTVIVLVNTPTPTPATKLVVNNQAPGFNPWFALLIPFGLVILGLAL